MFRNCGQKEYDQLGEIDTNALYILVVDDNPIEAEHAKMVLKEVGISADSCTSGQEALRKMEIQHVRKHPYNIVLMDWNMPIMNGMETSAEILRLYKKESIVAAMTAYSWDDISIEAHSVGVEGFVEKPLFTANIIENIKADHAENGKAAVELFEKSTPGIYSEILMDVRMPLMDGLEAAKNIRSMEREDAKRIPIIALTANSFDEDVQLSMQAGMKAHLSKPVEAERLIRVLGELVCEAEEKITLR